MGATEIIILLVFAFGASFTQRVTGFGFGIFIMTALPYLMPTYGEATALSGALACICAVMTAIKTFKYFDWRKFIIIMMAFLVVSYFSVKAVARMQDNNLRHILGVILIAVSVYFFFFSGKIHMKPSVPVQLSMGSLSGLMGGFFAMQGPPAVIYFLACTKTKEQYMALTSMYFVAGNIMMTLFRAQSGFVTPTVCRAWLFALPAVVLGLVLGSKVYDRLPIATIRKVVYAFMALAGLLALLH